MRNTLTASDPAQNRVSSLSTGAVFWRHHADQRPGRPRGKYGAPLGGCTSAVARGAPTPAVDRLLRAPRAQRPSDLPALWDQLRHVLSLVAPLRSTASRQLGG